MSVRWWRVLRWWLGGFVAKNVAAMRVYTSGSTAELIGASELVLIALDWRL